LPSEQLQSFFEWTVTNFDQSLVESIPFFFKDIFELFRDVGVGNLFLNLVSKTDYNGSMKFKLCDYAGQGRC
jgi:hypothetical protein